MSATLTFVTFWAISNPATVGDVENSPHLSYGHPGGEVEGRTLIARRGYAALHDASTRTPLWVSYRLEGDDIHEPGDRPSWRADPDLERGSRAEDADYKKVWGFERGHMAPNADITKDRPSQVETFYLSNVVPQDGDNNGGFWARLEERGREYAERYGEIFVITGPVFDKPLPDGTIHLASMIGDTGVRVPTHLFKIFIRKTRSGQIRTLALLVPNIPIPPADYPLTSAQILAQRPAGALRTNISASKTEYYGAQKQFLTTIDRIEDDTGINFLNALPVLRQESIEAKKARKMW